MKLYRIFESVTGAYLAMRFNNILIALRAQAHAAAAQLQCIREIDSSMPNIRALALTQRPPAVLT